MSLEIVAGLLGSQLVRAVASEVATTLACQAIQHAVGTIARPSDTRSRLSDAAEAPPPVLRALPTIEVLSAVPGRVRLRVHGMRGDADRGEAIVARALQHDGVTAAEARPLTGTVLISFDPRRTDLPAIVRALEPPARPARPTRRRARGRHLRLVAG